MLASLLDMTRLMFAALPQVLLNGWAALLLLVAVGLVFVQYRRVSMMEQELLGSAKHEPVEQTLYALTFGLLGGLLGSLILTWMGVGLVEAPGRVSALLYLWPISFVLGLINPRFLCFAYGATLLSVSYLVLGWPQVDIPTVIGVVAVLHLVEALLILISGATCASPMSVPRGDKVVPGFSVQRFWPVPLILPLFAPGIVSPAEMPAWWPLLKSDPLWLEGLEVMGWQLMPVVVTMGYSDLAITAPPEQRSRASARLLLAYSAVLLVLAVLAGHYRPLLWAAALFSGFGHEAMAVWSGRVQLLGRPYFERPELGVGVLDVLPKSVAAMAGLRSGSVILTVEDHKVDSREQLHEALMGAPEFVRLMFKDGERLVRMRVKRPTSGLLGLGVILLPEPGDQAVAQVHRRGILRWTGLEK
jgi:hypothetical protein